MARHETTELISYSGGSNIFTNNDEIRHLPLCIVEKILVKLPIKYVLRCKRVCKPWYDLIVKDPIFAKNYKKTSSFDWVLGTRINDIRSLHLLETEGAVGDIMAIPFDAKEVSDKAVEYLQVVGSCNGLCCVLVCYPISIQYKNIGHRTHQPLTVAIFNPTTGESLDLPKGKFQESRQFVYGFGFCPSTRTYKVVRIGQKYYRDDYKNRNKVIGQIFTLGVDNNWRDFEDPSFPLRPCEYQSVCLNGFFHWLGHYKEDVLIYAFNFEEEKSRCIALPLEFEFHLVTFVIVLGDYLCAAIRKDNQLDIWVMKEYGVAESWTKDIILKDSVSYPINIMRPATLLKNGRILCWVSNRDWVAYDPKEEKYTRFACRLRTYVPYLPRFSSLKDVIAEQNDETPVNPNQNRLSNKKK